MSTYKFKSVRVVISQPRVANAPKEWALPVADLLTFGEKVSVAGGVALDQLRWPASEVPPSMFCVSDEACRFCPAKATCPTLRQEVLTAIASVGSVPEDAVSFDDLDVVVPTGGTPADTLGEAMRKAKLIEDWCTAVRAEVERRLLSGQGVDGYKLVQGRRGHRKWTNPNEVEELLKKWRCKTEEMYKLDLISPTEAERRMAEWMDGEGFAHKPLTGPRNWKKLLALVHQPEGKPSVAPVSDKRPALVVGAQADDFVNETAADDLL